MSITQRAALYALCVFNGNVERARRMLRGYDPHTDTFHGAILVSMEPHQSLACLEFKRGIPKEQALTLATQLMDDCA